MDLGAFGEWWNSGLGVLWSQQQWGTVANWFSAVGTVSAFGLGIGILFRDRKLRRQGSADSFVTWMSNSMNLTRQRKPYNSKLLIYGHNAGTLTIPYSQLHIRMPDMTYMQLLFRSVDDLWDIPPGARVDLVVELGDQHGSKCEVVVEFTDGRGQRWFRDTKANKYISKRAFKRFIGPSAKDNELLGKYRDPAVIRAE